MKNVIKCSLLAVLLLSTAASVFGVDGDLSTGNRTCTTNCTASAVAITDDPAESIVADESTDASADSMATVIIKYVGGLLDTIM